MKRRPIPSPAAMALIREGISQNAIAEAVDGHRRSIGNQLEGRYRLQPEVLVVIRAYGGTEVADEIEHLAHTSWIERHPKAAAKAEVAS